MNNDYIMSCVDLSRGFLTVFENIFRGSLPGCDGQLVSASGQHEGLSCWNSSRANPSGDILEHLHSFAGSAMFGLFLICTYTKPCHRNSRARR